MNKIVVDNAQFTLCYLLIASDGSVGETEKNVFLDVVSRIGGFTKSYSESVFNAMHRFTKSLNYKQAVESLSQANDEQKRKTIELLRELSFADKTYHKDEVKFILGVQKDLQLV